MSGVTGRQKTRIRWPARRALRGLRPRGEGVAPHWVGLRGAQPASSSPGPPDLPWALGSPALLGLRSSQEDPAKGTSRAGQSSRPGRGVHGPPATPWTPVPVFRREEEGASRGARPATPPAALVTGHLAQAGLCSRPAEACDPPTAVGPGASGRWRVWICTAGGPWPAAASPGAWGRAPRLPHGPERPGQKLTVAVTMARPPPARPSRAPTPGETWVSTLEGTAGEGTQQEGRAGQEGHRAPGADEGAGLVRSLLGLQAWHGCWVWGGAALATTGSEPLPGVPGHPGEELLDSPEAPGGPGARGSARNRHRRVGRQGRRLPPSGRKETLASRELAPQPRLTPALGVSVTRGPGNPKPTSGGRG